MIVDKTERTLLGIETCNAAAIAALLRRVRYRIGTEAALQASIAEALESSGASFAAEVRLAPGERIDFMIDPGVGIEAKVKCDKRAIYRQLERYAAREQVQALILVTGTAMGLPADIGGKPLFYVSIGRGWL